MMKLVSFNVNSIRMRQHQLEALVAHQPAVIGLQETKVPDDQFPLEMIHELGYEAYYHGQKTHYGVAILVRQDLVKDTALLESTVIKGFPQEEPDHQRRFIGVDVAGVTVLNGYFPQGEERGHPTKFPAKALFYERLQHFLNERYRPEQKIAVMGDFNIAPQDIDVGIGEDNARRWLRTGKCSFLPEEREWLHALTSWGLSDSYRMLYPDDDTALSWFDYRSRGFERSPRSGLRIDYILLSDGLKPQCKDAGIYLDLRGMDKPSDHCPVWVDLDIDS